VQMLQKKNRRELFWEIKEKVEYYYCSALLIYLWHLASRSVLRCSERTKFVYGQGSAPDPAGGAHDAPPDR